MPGPRGEESDDQKGEELLEKLLINAGNEESHNVREIRVDNDELGSLYSAFTGGVVMDSTCTAAMLVLTERNFCLNFCMSRPSRHTIFSLDWRAASWW